MYALHICMLYIYVHTVHNTYTYKCADIQCHAVKLVIIRLLVQNLSLLDENSDTGPYAI